MTLGISLWFLTLSIVSVSATTYPILPNSTPIPHPPYIDPILCTTQYAPVCGYTTVQCVSTPCEPIRQTYGNSCMAAAAGVKKVTQWACDDGIPPIDPIVVWRDRDSHGCITADGYMWEARLARCIRPSEERVAVINILHESVPCLADPTQNCLQVKHHSGNEILANPIIGFHYLPGYNYRLLVKRDALSDRSAYHYTLIRILSQPRYSYTYLPNTDWSIAMLNGTVITSPGTLSFTRNRIYVNLCNTFSGSYTADWANLSVSQLISTKMYCMTDAMDVENALHLENATYVLSENTLTIHTRGGDAIVWKKKVY